VGCRGWRVSFTGVDEGEIGRRKGGRKRCEKGGGLPSERERITGSKGKGGGYGEALVAMQESLLLYAGKSCVCQGWSEKMILLIAED
jgi:hypothetical protein